MPNGEPGAQHRTRMEASLEPRKDHFGSTRFPDTVVSIAVEPKTNADRDRFEEVLAKIQREDPTLQSRVDEETGQTLLSGMGELHLEVVLGKMERDFNLRVNHGKPRVTYRETAAGPGTGRACLPV